MRLLGQLAEVARRGGTIVERSKPWTGSEEFTAYPKAGKPAGTAAEPAPAVGTKHAVFARELCEALADCRFDRAGRSALTLIAQRVPVTVSDDVDAQGKTKPVGILPSGLFPEAPRKAFVAVRDPADALMVLPGRTVDSDLPLLPLDVEDAGAPLLRLADAAGIGALQKGRGARMDKRLLFFSLLSMPLAEHYPGGRYNHSRPLRWWVERLYPNRYRPSEAEGQIRAGGIVTARAAAPQRRRDGTLYWPPGNVPVADWRHPAAVIEGVERHPRGPT